MSNLLPTTVVAIGISAGVLGVAFAEAPAAPAQKQIIQVEIGASGANTNNNYQAASCQVAWRTLRLAPWWCG